MRPDTCPGSVLDEDAQEILRLRGLSTRWLARYVLASARALRSGPIICRPYDIANEPRLYWQLIPELSFRLGERCFDNHERQDEDVRALSDTQLKFYCLLAWQSLYRPAAVRSAHARVFFRNIADDNPLALALDRLVSPQASGVQHQHGADRIPVDQLHGLPGWPLLLADAPAAARSDLSIHG